MACQQSEMNVLCDLGLLQKQHLTISIEHEGKITSLEIYVFYMLNIIKDIKIYAILNFFSKALTPTAYLNHR